MEKLINFGKIEYTNKYKINSIGINLKLNEKLCINYINGKKENMFIFSADCSIYDRKNNLIACGVDINKIQLHINMNENELFLEILKICNDYNHNNMQIGLKDQIDAIDGYLKLNNLSYNFNNVCEYLKCVNLFEVNGLKYNHFQKFCKPIPQNIINRIIEIIN